MNTLIGRLNLSESGAALPPPVRSTSERTLRRTRSFDVSATGASSKTIYNAATHQVEAVCGECGASPLRFEEETRTDPPLYVHRCVECAQRALLRERFPTAAVEFLEHGFAEVKLARSYSRGSE